MWNRGLNAAYWPRVADHYDGKGEDDLNYLAAIDKKLVHHHSGLFSPGHAFTPDILRGGRDQEILKAIGESEARLTDLGLDTLRRWGAQGPGLDCGCGRGGSSLTFALSLENLVIDGITVSEAQACFARRAAEDLGLSERVSYSTKNVFDLAAGMKSAYGFIYACESTEYMAPRHELFRVWARVLKPGGYAFVFGLTFLEDHPLLSREDLDQIDDHYVTRIGSFQEYVYGSAAAGLELVDLVDLGHHVIPYWTLRLFSSHQAGTEESILRGIQDGAMKYSLMIFRKPVHRGE